MHEEFASAGAAQWLQKVDLLIPSLEFTQYLHMLLFRGVIVNFLMYRVSCDWLITLSEDNYAQETN